MPELWLHEYKFREISTLERLFFNEYVGAARYLRVVPFC